MTWVAIAAAILLLLWFLLRPAERRRFVGLTEIQLQRYIAYATEALASGGWISVHSATNSGNVTVRKRDLKRNPPRLTLRVNGNGVDRAPLWRVAEALEASGIQHRRIYTRRLRLPCAVEVNLDSADPLMPAACTQIIRKALEILGPAPSRYSLLLAGPFKPGFPPQDGEVIPHDRPWRYGYRIGYFLGSLVRGFRRRGQN